MDKGVAVIYNKDLDDEYDNEREVIMIATFKKGTKGRIYANEDILSMGLRSNKLVGGAEIEPLNFETMWSNEFGEADVSTLIGYNIQEPLNGNTFDLMSEIKKVSDTYLANGGKRYALEDLMRWNKVRSKPMLFMDNIMKEMAFKKGAIPKLAKVALHEARLCLKLYHKIKRNNKVRVFDANTGKRPACVVGWWGDFGEEE